MLIFVLNLIAGRISRVQCSVRRRNSHHSLWNQGRGMVKPPAAPLVGWQLVLHGLASEEMHRQFTQHWDIPRYWTSCFRYFRSNLCIGVYSLTIQSSSEITSSIVHLTDHISFSGCSLPGALCRCSLNSETYCEWLASMPLIVEHK